MKMLTILQVYGNYSKTYGQVNVKIVWGYFHLKKDDKSIENPKYTADQFNIFVCVSCIKDQGSHLTSNFGKLKEFCDEKTPEITYFSIPFISQEKVEKYFRNININKVTGSDNIGSGLS